MSEKGSVVVLTRDVYERGVEAGQIAEIVIRGKSSGSIPFHQCTASKLLINPAAAAACGVNIPDSLLKTADTIIGQ